LCLCGVPRMSEANAWPSGWSLGLRANGVKSCARVFSTLCIAKRCVFSWLLLMRTHFYALRTNNARICPTSSALVLERIMSAEWHSLHELLTLLAYRWTTCWCPPFFPSKIVEAEVLLFLKEPPGILRLLLR